MIPFPNKKYKTIVADPPWKVKAGPIFNSNGKSRDLEYQTMSVDEIRALDVSSIAENNAHLYLWTINKYVEDAYAVCRSWGFKPSTLLVWNKAPMGIGLGGTYVLATEYILFARKGTCPALKRLDRNWWNWKRQSRHSKKPEEFQDMVETVSPAPRIELFARREREGWDTWGDEV